MHGCAIADHTVHVGGTDLLLLAHLDCGIVGDLNYSLDGIILMTCFNWQFHN